MAGNKVNTKTKAKEDKNKASSKSIGQSGEETEETDFALLRKPIPTSITGFGQARKIFDLATEELKDLLSNECDLLYECKVCRNIFRSLANFISHKRVYCKEKFSSSLHSHFINATSTYTELLKIKHLEQGYQASLKENVENDKETDDADDRVPLTKDLTAIVEKIAKNKGVYQNNNEEPEIALQKIPNSSVAVFQSVQSSEDRQNENMKAQVNELDSILSRDIAVLQSDGNFKVKSSVSEESDNVIQISDDEDNNDVTNVLKCKICDMQFSTQKTLKFHMKYKHVETRLVYPCPDCLEIFSTSWSVYRHLFKVHRKTAAQIRRLRESIQAKAFKMNNPPAFYEKRKNNMKSVTAQKISEEERLEQENQAWMDNLECDGSAPRCGGCGRTFERRAALAAHTHTCPPRSRALARRPHETKKIEIQIRKDYHKGPSVHLNLPVKADANENKTTKDEQQAIPKPKEEEKQIVIEDKEADEDKDEDDDNKEVEDAAMDVSDDDSKSNDAPESPDKVPEKRQIDPPKLNIRLPFAHQAEKGNLAAFRQRIQSEIEITKMLCKRCDAQFGETQELYDHVAEHVKWMRYACKLCNFKHYYFEKLPEHVKVVHKLKGDKDFYYSTVKAIDGPEALELCESTDELPDAAETSPESRRPSRCSSDSSRLSDDSSSSSTRVEGLSRKRKVFHTKTNAKKRKEFVSKPIQDKDGDSSVDKSINLDNYSSTTVKNFEENSSDLDDIDAKKQLSNENASSVASRRPVRRRTKPKNADFEYDLSNLLKMEAQGYRDSISMATAKSGQTKKKAQEVQSNYDNINKECCGALITLSKKCVERASAHIKTDFTTICPQKDIRLPNVFVRPMLPKLISRGDKISPKKENNEDTKESPSPVKEVPEKASTVKNVPVEEVSKVKDEGINSKPELVETAVVSAVSSKEQNSIKPIIPEIIKPKSLPSVVPFKFRRQSLEVMKNPIINKNISDFTKSGLKTKILVIKPINRNKDGTQVSPLKFQTIKLKDPNKRNSSEDQDQVVVVKVPKVECAIAQPISKVPNKNQETASPASSETPVETSKPAITTPTENSKSLTPEDINNDTSDTTVSDTNVEKNVPTDIEECISLDNDTMDSKSEDRLLEDDDDDIVEETIDESVISKETATEVIDTTVL
ncbi:uncharacterized protein LOC111355577 [Spodoptera litura]|uniref:Uncharacterized protein LOC111355577 n=1 Tax=Spodoptera litura TaxID=69820 RepID=A0A9J7IUB7_SPOLT|nr:uncharacterized protein LOC111355577 [Spodoptera litura]XP_022825332.1 uncharacterized protein LOC111355577 [Spodoptera litura]